MEGYHGIEYEGLWTLETFEKQAPGHIRLI